LAWPANQKVAWCRENIPNSRFDLVPLRPPTTLPESAYDLVIGISVLTHLDEPTQLVWLEELQRVTKPGGYLLLTTHGESALARVGDIDIILKTLTAGTDASTADPALNKTIASSDYYKSTYHLRTYAQSVFRQFFDFIDIVGGGNASLQDIVILRRR
jgi:SAM-dependent methyltransferase